MSRREEGGSIGLSKAERIKAADAIKVAFPPVADAAARILVLGSMPGDASLAAQEYYAHPRNAFWDVMGAIAGAKRELPYPQRLQKLRAAHIALWDVCAACQRAGSLDTAIDHASVMPNDFAAFLRVYPRIHTIVLNGQSVATLFRRHVQASQILPAGIQVQVLPSTSPANARLATAQKVAHWQSAWATLQTGSY